MRNTLYTLAGCVTVGIVLAFLLGRAIDNTARDAVNAQHRSTAILACVANPAYIGANDEDNRALFAQCVDDYYRMQGWR